MVKSTIRLAYGHNLLQPLKKQSEENRQNPGTGEKTPIIKGISVRQTAL